MTGYKMALKEASIAVGPVNLDATIKCVFWTHNAKVGSVVTSDIARVRKDEICEKENSLALF